MSCAAEASSEILFASHRGRGRPFQSAWERGRLLLQFLTATACDKFIAKSQSKTTVQNAILSDDPPLIFTNISTRSFQGMSPKVSFYNQIIQICLQHARTDAEITHVGCVFIGSKARYLTTKEVREYQWLVHMYVCVSQGRRILGLIINWTHNYGSLH